MTSTAMHTYTLLDRDSGATLDISAPGLLSARERAVEWASDGDWDTSHGTVWVDVAIIDWQSPHDIVGGLVENPGVRGNGGGIVSLEVCIHCGCARTTDTWAQRPDTGEQGLTSVSYEPGRFADEVAALAESDDE